MDRRKGTGTKAQGQEQSDRGTRIGRLEQIDRNRDRVTGTDGQGQRGRNR